MIKTIFILIILNFTLTVPYRMDVDTQILKDRLEDFVVHSLKKTEMQNHLNFLRFKYDYVNGNKILNELASSFANEYQLRIDAVQKLALAVRRAYSTTIPSSRQCCETSSTLTFDPRFKREINPLSSCEFVSTNAQENPIRLTREFREQAVDNLKNIPTLKWQYFGSDQGVTTMYPSILEDVCGSFDARTRPWYVQASVPLVKQVVIVLDKSGSMKEVQGGYELMFLAKEAAIAVLSTLNPYDKVTVLAISDRQEVLTDHISTGNGECFRTRLAQATPQNKKNINDFIHKIDANGGTYYTQAFDRAFQFFTNELGSSSAVERVIHFMSDGLPNDSPDEFLKKLTEKHATLSNSVVVMTYGIGVIDSNKILKDISQNNPSFKKKGDLLKINGPEDVRNLVSTYYKIHSSANRATTDPIWSVPYLDSLGLGQMITASLPVYKGVKLLGVVGVDLTLDDLLSTSSFTKHNEFTYAFVIDKAGLIINHPLFPYVDDNESLFVEATAFERDVDFHAIFDSMKRGRSGRQRVWSEKVLPEGDSRKYGVSKHLIRSDYIWKRIPGTTFSVCLVLSGTTHKILSAQSPVLKGEFLYHRIDLVPPKSPCNHFNNFASLDQTSVFLSARTFKDHKRYLNHKFTATDVEDIVNFMEGVGKNTFDIKDGIRDEVSATQFAETLWTRQDENTVMQSEIVWRFLATRNGVYRVYPGSQVPDAFDPVSRPWFDHALAHRDKASTITPPYEDTGGGGGVITISQVLLKKRLSRKEEKGGNIFGVMGIDITLSHFNDLFLQWYPICQARNVYACYLIDNGGFIISTNNLVKGDGTVSSMYAAFNWEAHVTELEPGISQVLIEDGVLQRINCSNIEAGQFQKSYTIPDNQDVYEGSFEHNFYDVFDFKLVPVEETNTFFLIRVLSVSECKSSTFTCPCKHASGISSDPSTCLNNISHDTCECPCSAPDPTYVPCQNKYVLDSSSPLPCTPGNRNFRSPAHEPVDISGLKKCFNISFSSEESKKIEQASYILEISASVGGVCGAVVVFIASYVVFRVRKEMKRIELRDELVKQYKQLSSMSVAFKQNFDSAASFVTPFRKGKEFWFKSKAAKPKSPQASGPMSGITAKFQDMLYKFSPLG